MSKKLNEVEHWFYQILMLVARKKIIFIKDKELSNCSFKMNNNTNKFLLTADKFISELNLKELGFTYKVSERL